MLPNEKAIIHIADKRPRLETDWFRTLHSLAGQVRSAEPVSIHGSLRGFNDETLKELSTITYESDRDWQVFLLPVVGGLQYRVDAGALVRLDAGEASWINVPAGSLLQITNPFEDELINYIHAWIHHENPVEDKNSISFDLDERNKMIHLMSEKGINIQIGKLAGRIEKELAVKGASVFAFVIEGAFEFANRLLQPRDSLSICGVDIIDFESLSNDAIILIIKFD